MMQNVLIGNKRIRQLHLGLDDVRNMGVTCCCFQAHPFPYYHFPSRLECVCAELCSCNSTFARLACRLKS